MQWSLKIGILYSKTTLFISDKVPDNIHITPLTCNVKQTVSILIEWDILSRLTFLVGNVSTASPFKEELNGA